MAKRKAIEYTAQFVPGVFRPPSEIETELEALDQEVVARPENTVPQLDTNPRLTSEMQNVRPVVRSNERPDDLSTGYGGEPRRRTRHSFDIWEDQLLSLAEIQAQRFTTTRRKPKLGELVQEALDAYIEEYKTTQNERMNERPNERTRRNA